MSSLDAETVRPIGRAFMGAFIGFFLGPAAVVATLMLSDPDRVTYGNGGVVLIFAVITGAACGAAIGSAADIRRRRRPSTARLGAELAGALTGGLLGGIALASSPWVGAASGAVFGAISGGLLLHAPPPVEEAGTIPTEDHILWDRDLDA